MKRLSPFAIIIAVLAIALGGAWYMMRSAQSVPPAPGGPSAPGPPAVTSSAASTAAPGADPPHFRGSGSAAVTLEEFGVFECPPCGNLHPILKTIESEYGSRWRVIFRDFPLSPPHVHAVAAARAAEAAGLQGKFFEMHDLLYENQKTWADAFDVRPLFEGYARKIGLDVERFKRDQTNEIVERRITLDGSRGHSLGVKSTPTIFLNGVEIPFAQYSPEGLRPVINKALTGGR